MAEPAVDQAATPCFNDYTSGERRVWFISMQHVTRPEFCAAGAGEVRSAKTRRCVDLNEFVDMCALDDTGQRKLRRLLLGINSTPADGSARFLLFLEERGSHHRSQITS